MRLVRLKIKSAKVRSALATVATQFRTGDVGFVEDCFALIRLRGSGLASKARQDALIKQLSTKGGMSAVNARIAVKKRFQVLNQAKTTGYFKGLLVMPDPIDATRRLLLNFQKLYLKYREVQCLTCQFRPNCDFGKQYQDKATDIRRVVDPDFKRKVNPSCPVLPELDSINQVVSAVQTAKKMLKQQAPEAEVAKVDSTDAADEKEAEQDDADQDELVTALDPDDDDFIDFTPPSSRNSGGGRGGTLASHRGAMFVRHFEKMTDDLTREQLVIFELGAKLGAALIQHKKGQFSPTADPTQNRKSAKMESMSDVTKLLPSEHAKPEEMFEKGVMNKELIKTQELEPKKKKPLLYLLIDASYSMRGYIPANAFGMLSRAGLAAVFSMALIRHVRDEGGMVFVRVFAGSPGPLIPARAGNDFDSLLQFVAHCDFNGGGTSIASALRAAKNDIRAAQDEVSRSEIILISDNEDSFSVKAVRAVLDGQPVNVLDVAAIDPASGVEYDGTKALKSVAAKYYKVDPTTLSIDDIISVV